MSDNDYPGTPEDQRIPLSGWIEHMGTNPQNWAQEFCRLHAGQTISDSDAREGDGVVGPTTMLNWFFNLIQAQAGKKNEVWSCLWHTAAEVDAWLQHLNDEGQEPCLALIDKNNTVWMAYGEEHTHGGEAMETWVVHGDPMDLIDLIDTTAGVGRGELRFDAVPLTNMRYPVICYTPKPRDVEGGLPGLISRFGDKQYQRRVDEGLEK